MLLAMCGMPGWDRSTTCCRGESRSPVSRAERSRAGRSMRLRITRPANRSASLISQREPIPAARPPGDREPIGRTSSVIPSSRLTSGRSHDGSIPTRSSRRRSSRLAIRRRRCSMGRRSGESICRCSRSLRPARAHGYRSATRSTTSPTSPISRARTTSSEARRSALFPAQATRRRGRCSSRRGCFSECRPNANRTRTTETRRTRRRNVIGSVSPCLRGMSRESPVAKDVRMKRREILKGLSAMAALTAVRVPELFAATKVDSTYKGVKLGLITGSLNPLPNVPGKDQIDVIIENCLAIGAANVELVNVGGQMPPQVTNGGRFGQAPDQKTPDYLKTREELRQWRINLPLDRFREVRKKFDDAGLNLFSYVYTIDDDMTDPEIDAVFRQMQALKVGLFCTNQTRVTMAARMVPFADKYKIKPAWHPHDNIDSPVEVATATTLEKLLAMSKNFVINLDIGHFTAGNNDAVDFLKKHHDRISHLHIKDRSRNHGPNVQLGTGQTPIKECLTLIRDNKWPIYGIIEREFRGPGTPVEETKWQMDYLKRILEA